jgi:hypothetical protein
MKPSIQTPWLIAKYTRLMILPTIIGLQTIGWYLTTWAEVYRSVDRSPE